MSLSWLGQMAHPHMTQPHESPEFQVAMSGGYVSWASQLCYSAELQEVTQIPLQSVRLYICNPLVVAKERVAFA